MQNSPANSSRLRALLVLGRVSNLPTVWSNCIAGWWLSGGGDFRTLVLFCLGATFLYVGGMYLNDAFDVEFDRQFRRERPIPSGVISHEAVILWSLGYITIGALLLASMGITTSILTLFLLLSIIFYDAAHKDVAWSPVVMAACRFFLFLAAASIGRHGVNGLAIWSACVLAAYIIGLSYLAKQESTPGYLKFWPCLLLGTPLVLAWIVNGGTHRTTGLIFMAILLVWVVRCVRLTYGLPKPLIGATVSGLLAGIVLVDLLAIAGGTPILTGVFLALFALGLVLQRFVPAT